MEKKKISVILCAAILLTSIPLFANKTTVTIEAPDSAKKGTEVTVKIHVSHSGNSFMHYTNLVVVKINGKEFKKWEYSSFNKPEAEKFTLTFKVQVTEDITIEAKGDCNMHGSKGKAELIIKAL